MWTVRQSSRRLWRGLCPRDNPGERGSTTNFSRETLRAPSPWEGAWKVPAPGGGSHTWWRNSHFCPSGYNSLSFRDFWSVKGNRFVKYYFDGFMSLVVVHKSANTLLLVILVPHIVTKKIRVFRKILIFTVLFIFNLITLFLKYSSSVVKLLMN